MRRIKTGWMMGALLMIVGSAAAAPMQATSTRLNLAAPASSASASSASAAAPETPHSPTALPGASEHHSPFVFRQRRPSYKEQPAPNESLQAAGRAPVIGPIWDRYGKATVNCSLTPMDAKCR